MLLSSLDFSMARVYVELKKKLSEFAQNFPTYTRVNTVINVSVVGTSDLLSSRRCSCSCSCSCSNVPGVGIVRFPKILNFRKY